MAEKNGNDTEVQKYRGRKSSMAVEAWRCYQKSSLCRLQHAASTLRSQRAPSAPHHCCPVRLYAILEVFCVCVDQIGSGYWAAKWAGETKALNFKFYLILISLNLKNYMWLMDAILDNTTLSISSISREAGNGKKGDTLITFSFRRLSKSTTQWYFSHLIWLKLITWLSLIARETRNYNPLF